MSKPTRGATKAAPGKKKAKVRPQPRPAVETASTVVSGEAVQAETNGGVAVTDQQVLQFRPRPREAAPARSQSGKTQSAKAALPATDYSYVYTDLRIIGVLVGTLLLVLIGLSFVIH